MINETTNVLIDESNDILKRISDLVFNVRSGKLYNEQWWINFEDELNKYSNIDFNK